MLVVRFASIGCWLSEVGSDIVGPPFSGRLLAMGMPAVRPSDLASHCLRLSSPIPPLPHPYPPPPLVHRVNSLDQALAEMPDDLGAIVKECIDELGRHGGRDWRSDRLCGHYFASDALAFLFRIFFLEFFFCHFFEVSRRWLLIPSSDHAAVGNTATDGSPEADASGNEGAESVAVDATA